MSTDIDWSGTWETNYGKVVLQQTKNIVTGVYVLKEGRIDGLALDDRLSGQWSEAPSYAPPNDAGEFEIHMDQSGTSFQGKWWKVASSNGKEWHGRKV
jgi:hypothetical protein